MSFDEPAIKSKWYEIPLGSDCEQEQRGRLQFRGGSRSVSEQDRIDNNGEATQKHIWKQRAENCKDQEDQNDATKWPADPSYTYKLGMMFVNGAAKVVNNVVDGGKQHRDTIKQLRADLDDSMLNCDKLARDVGNAKLWIAYYESQNGSLVNQMEESNRKFSLERQSMLEKLMKFEEDAECSRKALAEVTRMKDALELKAEETKKIVTKMNNQVESAELPEASSTLIRELSQKLKDKEAQLKDATRALRISVSHGEKLRDHLLTTSKSMKSQTIEMRRCSTALESAMNESYTLKGQLEEESHKRKDVEKGP